MTLKSNDFNTGQADNAAVTTGNSGGGVGNSAFSVVSAGTGGSIVYDSDLTTPSGFLWSGLFTNSTTASPVIVGLSDTAATSFACRAYFYLTGYPTVTGSFGIRGQTSAAAQTTKAYISTTGQLMIVGTFGTVNATGTVIPLNQWIRWEFWGSGLTTAASQYTTAWYSVHSASASDSVATGSVTTGATENMAEIRYGRNQTAMNMAPFSVTGIAQNIGSATPIGPAADTQAPTVPTGLVVTSIGATTATVQWNASSDNVGVTGYEITITGP